ncbi:MAG TPA: phage terminase large subunit [Candidatus Tripitaka californicus]|uniref:phage terminase large subunit n=1 Tax=Candidatus Tripitaka californicus TaxID=3367616 RepID=UPI00402A5BCE
MSRPKTRPLLKDVLKETESGDDPETFARRYLSHYLTAPAAPFHKELYHLMASKEANKPCTRTVQGKREAIAAPRGHGKSVLTSLVFPLWAICTRRKRFIVLLSSSSAIAEGFLASITRELEENALLRRDFGELVGREKWTDRDILTSTGIRVSARGVDSSLRGMRSFESRPDLIICDDLEDEEVVLNPQNREKLKNWFFGSVLNLLGPTGDVFVIGTILHHDSLLSLLIKAWRGRRYQALSPEGEALWPGYYDGERLLLIKNGDGQKEGIGTLAFECEYQNNPISPEEQLFRPEWIRYYSPEELKGELLIVTALDPALGGGGRWSASGGHSHPGDYSALVTVGQQAGRIYVLEVELVRGSPRETLEAAVRNFQRWSTQCGMQSAECGVKITNSELRIPHFLCLAIETNAFQVVLKDMLEEMSRKQGLFIPIRPVRNFSDKVARVGSLSPLVESGSILFRKDDQPCTNPEPFWFRANKVQGQKALIDQLIQFPKGAHDDGPDALEMAVRMLRRHGEPRVRFV